MARKSLLIVGALCLALVMAALYVRSTHQEPAATAAQRQQSAPRLAERNAPAPADAPGTTAGRTPAPPEQLHAELTPTAPTDAAGSGPSAKPAPANGAPLPDPVPHDEAVAGTSPFPEGGKPTGPFDLAWNLVRHGTAVTGSITVKNLASTSPVEISIRALGSAVLESPAQTTCDLASGALQNFPVAVHMTEGRGSLTVTVAHLRYVRKARTITILLADDGGSAAQRAAGAAPSIGSAAPANRPDASTRPLTGSRIITDDAGQTIELHPAAPGK